MAETVLTSLTGLRPSQSLSSGTTVRTPGSSTTLTGVAVAVLNINISETCTLFLAWTTLLTRTSCPTPRQRRTPSSTSCLINFSPTKKTRTRPTRLRRLWRPGRRKTIPGWSCPTSTRRRRRTSEWQSFLSTWVSGMFRGWSTLPQLNNWPVFWPDLTFRENQQNNVYWWRYCIRLENLGDATVQLRERNWRIFSLSGTLETVRGRGVVGQEPILSRDQPAFQYSSHVSLQAPSGHMWWVQTAPYRETR